MFADAEWRNAIFGSLALHVLLVAAMLFAAWDWPSQRRPNRTGLNIDARIVDISQFQQQVREQRIEAERAVQQQRERERLLAEREAALQAQREREERAQQEREQQQREQDEREQAEAERQRREAEAREQAERERQAELQRQQEAERRRQELEAQRQAEAERQRQEEARRQQELEDIRRQREEAERRRRQEQERLQQLEDQRRRELEAQRLAELQAQEEAERQAAENNANRGRLEANYQDVLSAHLAANWIRPPTAKKGVFCKVRVTQIPGGEVVDAVIVDPGNADSITQRSVIDAVMRNDLPYRGFEDVFQRELIITFEPDKYE